jgi:hypothetical protein
LSDAAHDKDLTAEKAIRNFEIVIVLYFMNRKKSFARNAFIPKEVIIIAWSRELIVARRNGCLGFKRCTIAARGVLQK